MSTTALMIASQLGRSELVRLLCEAGANKDRAQHNGDQSRVAESGSPDAVMS